MECLELVLSDQQQQSDCPNNIWKVKHGTLTLYSSDFLRRPQKFDKISHSVLEQII